MTELGIGQILVWETLGTAILIVLGTGVVANVQLAKTNGHKAGTLMVTFGWGFGVFAGASVADTTGAHLNPAVTIGQAIVGTTPWAQVPVYWFAQMLGAIIGATLCWLAYKKQFDTHDDPSSTLGVFSTAPTVPSKGWNTVTEVIATFVLVAWVLLSPGLQAAGTDGVPQFGNGALGYAGVAFVVMGIGQSLGGPTGYAINPARDLGPRIAYAILPIRGKGGANWGYAWVPVVGPLLGGALAGVLALALAGMK